MPSRINMSEIFSTLKDEMLMPVDTKKRDQVERQIRESVKQMRSIFDNKAYSTKHVSFSNVSLLNGYKPKKYLYKYLKYNNFINSVNAGKLVFVSPLLWQDPWECVYYETDYSSYSYFRPQIACLCTTENTTENEDAAWKLYVNNPQEKSLRISLDVDSLLYQLNEYAKNNDCQIFMGKMIYEFNRGEIEKLHSNANQFFKDQFFFSPFTDANYLSLMCLKRKAFEYENEVRVFIVKSDSLYESNNNIVSIDIDFAKIVKRIVIAPLHPYEYGDPRKNKYSDFAEIEHEALKESLKSVIPLSIPIFRSVLYEANKVHKV